MFKQIFWVLAALALLLVGFSACGAADKEGAGGQAAADTPLPFKRAKNMLLSRTAAGCYRLRIPSAWQAGGEGRAYLLCPKDKAAAQTLLPKEQLIPLPALRIVCSSTVQAAMLAFLGEAGRIVGMTDGRYLYDEKLSERLRSGDIVDLGGDGTIDYERLVALEPDLVLIFGQGAASKLAQQLEQLRIPHIYIAEYLEEDVLGRSEWLRLMGILVGSEQRADSLYEKAIFEPYERLRELVATRPLARPKPTVIAGVAYEGTWYAAGGRSYIAQLVGDAGGNYIWSADTSRGGLPLSWERAYEEGKDAEFWLNVGQARSMGELLAVDGRYADWEAFKRKQVFNYHKRVSKGGGYDVFESAVVQPHLLLRDWSQIIRHEGFFNVDSLYYYAPLK